jgi:hypothetical protein
MTLSDGKCRLAAIQAQVRRGGEKHTSLSWPDDKLADENLYHRCNCSFVLVWSMTCAPQGVKQKESAETYADTLTDR